MFIATWISRKTPVILSKKDKSEELVVPLGLVVSGDGRWVLRCFTETAGWFRHVPMDTICNCRRAQKDAAEQIRKAWQNIENPPKPKERLLSEKTINWIKQGVKNGARQNGT